MDNVAIGMAGQTKTHTTRIGIVGYGNLGKGVQAALKQNSDMELAGIFTRRDPASLTSADETDRSVNFYHIDDLAIMKDKIDVLVLCGGSATDLPTMTPQLAQDFNVIDSFDTHAKIPEHFASVDQVAHKAKTVAIISVGWDPGLFSLSRALGQAVLPIGKDYTFWGKGVSQGHSDALRRIEGVADARQYTIPVETALNKVRQGETPDFSTREKHTRLCFVVAKEGADTEKIRQEIVGMPYYFDEYDTEVNFISEEELMRDHGALPHGGIVLRSGKTGFSEESTQIVEYKLQLDSNPEFTASVLVAYARAAHRLYREGKSGCYTVFDVAPAYLMDMNPEDMRKNLL